MNFHRTALSTKETDRVRRYAKTSSAASTQGSGTLRAHIRRAFATGGDSRRANGSGAPSAKSRRPKLLALAAAAILATLVLGVSLAAAEAPKVTIENASAVEYTTATVKGEVDPTDHETSYRFQYATEPDFSNAEGAGFGSLAEGSGPTPVEAELTELRPNTTYHLRLLAENSEGETSEAVAATFTTKAVAKPTVSIEPVSAFTGATAHFVGHINPNAPAGNPAAFDVTWRFVCTPACPGGVESGHQLPADNTSHEVSADATGLQPGAPYEVSLVAENAGGAETKESAGPVSFTTAAEAPTIAATFASAVTSTTATINAEINPRGAPTTYHFEYLTEQEFEAGGFSAAKSVPASDAPLPGVNERQEVSLASGELNFFELIYSGESTAPILRSATPAEVQAALEALPALVPGQIAVTGRPTGGEPWIVEFTGTLGATDLPSLEIADGHPNRKADTLANGGPQPNAAHPVSASLAGLLPQTLYAYRVVANNEESPPGGTPGPSMTFFTPSGAAKPAACPNQQLREENTSLDLPDCRAYELVSAADSGEVFIPYVQFTGEKNSQVLTTRPMQSSPAGDAVTYAGGPPPSGEGEGTGGTGRFFSGDQYLATRAPGGWRAVDFAPLGHGFNGELTGYYGFSEDLSRGALMIAGAEPQLSPQVTAHCRVLYARDVPVGAYEPFFDAAPCGEPFFAGFSSDGSAALFESFAAMTPDAQPTSGETGHDNIYYRSGGGLDLVNILPGGLPDPNATVGSLAAEPPVNEEPLIPPVNAANAISADGDRVFWTDLETGTVYVRENPAAAEECTAPNQPGKSCTIQVSAGSATYQTATPDGRFAYYTENGELWRFDVQEGTREVLAAGPSAAVQGVIGVNRTGEDGSYLYFVAEGALASGAETRTCKAAVGESGAPQSEQEEAAEESEGKAPPGRGCNLYLLHSGQTSLVAVLLPTDNELAGSNTELYAGGNPSHGDWAPVAGFRAAQLTPDGHSLLFTSTRQLTSYANIARPNCSSGGLGAASSISRASCAELYLYRDGSVPGPSLTCVSCDPRGLAPVRELGQRPGAGTYLPMAPANLTHTPRLISADGARVFFQTRQPLVQADTNGQLDTYEWERQGSGTCAEGSPFNGGGCVYLLSGGKDIELASLIDTDEAGTNVFLTTRARLSPSDRDNKVDLYDARVNGGFAVPSEESCEAEACKAPLSPVPASQSPGSASFQANEPPPAKCKKGKVKKRGKCVSKKHHSKHHKHKEHHNRTAHSNRRAGR